MALQYFIKWFFFDTLNCSLATNCGLILVRQTVWTEFRGPHTRVSDGLEEMSRKEKKCLGRHQSVCDRKKEYSAVIETFNKDNAHNAYKSLHFTLGANFNFRSFMSYYVRC